MRKASRSALFLIAIFSLSFDTIASAAVASGEATNVETVHHEKKYGKSKKYRKYSKAWWRQYRSRVRRQRALQAR